MNDIFNFYTETIIITAIFILVIFLFRFIIRKKSNRLICALWICLLVRLLFPVSIETGASFGKYETPEIISTIIESDNTYNSNNNEKNTYAANDRNDTGIEINYMYIWYFGISLFVIYYIIHRFLLRKNCKNSEALADYDNVRTWDKAEACVIGVFNPVIYFPKGLNSDETEIIIKHESTHIKRRDNIFVFLYFIALTLYWYNPLVWISYFMALGDVENACDEQALLNSNLEERKEYARVLLDFYKSRTTKDVFSLSFGKRNIKRRIENIGKQRKLKKVHIALITIACILLLVVGALFYIGGRGSNMPEKIGNEQIGATIPNIIYADTDKVIFYDYHGVFAYDFDKLEVTDYISFEELEVSTNVQGDNATYAYSSSDGSLIYITDYNNIYTYDCNKYKLETKEYSEDFFSGVKLYSLNISDKIYDDAVSSVYSVENFTDIYWAYDGTDGIYSDLYIIMNKDGNIYKYSVFE